MSKSCGSLLFVIALLGVGLVVVVNMSDDSGSSSVSIVQFDVSDELNIGVIGKKFQWDFRYPGPDGLLNTSDDVYAERLLYIPPHSRITFHITSEDYVYILGIPLNENDSQLVGKGERKKLRDIAVPDLTHFIEHTFTETGTYDLMVDPLCGFQSLHDPRMGQIVVSIEHNFLDLFPRAKQDNETL